MHSQPTHQQRRMPNTPYRRVEDTNQQPSKMLSSNVIERNQKFVYQMDEKRIYAGGLLIYDSSGIWVLKEYYKGGYKLSDPGGKYAYQDCNIYVTIAREFCEETYFAFPVTFGELKTLVDTNKATSVFVCNDPDSNPTYLCLLVNKTDLPSLSNIQLDTSEFINHRTQALKENPRVPEQYYSSFDFFHLPYEEIHSQSTNLHFRLRQICQKSSLLSKYLRSYTCPSISEEYRTNKH